MVFEARHKYYAAIILLCTKEVIYVPRETTAIPSASARSSFPLILPIQKPKIDSLDFLFYYPVINKFNTYGAQ
jgi:hypothetical protein